MNTYECVSAGFINLHLHTWCALQASGAVQSILPITGGYSQMSFSLTFMIDAHGSHGWLWNRVYEEFKA